LDVVKLRAIVLRLIKGLLHQNIFILPCPAL